MNNGGTDMAADSLVAEGIEQFLDAQYALNRFKAELGNISKEILEKNIDNLAKLLKIETPSLDKVWIECWPSELEPDYDGTSAWIGAAVWFGEPISCTFHVGLSFDQRN